MTVKAYRAGAFETTHENKAYDQLLNSLETEWGESDELVVLLGNFLAGGQEIDAAVLMKRSISVIDFKNYDGKVTFSENGNWHADGKEVRGGNKVNPFRQIRDNKFALLRILKKFKSPSGREPNYGHISGIVLFQKSIDFDDNQIPGNIASWFHVVDMGNIVKLLSQIISPEINLSNKDRCAMAKSFDIPRYKPPGAKTRISTQATGHEKLQSKQVPRSLPSAADQHGKFTRDRCYTRDEIHNKLGGSKQSYLPTVAGIVVAGCFQRSPSSNPDAPDIILPGFGPIVTKTADQFAKQGNAVPTFLKKRPGCWIYQGKYRVKEQSHDEEIINHHADKANREGDVSSVLFLEREEDEED